MLDFADKDAVKIAYASSVGTMWESEDRETVKNLLKRFQNIGVREHSIQKELDILIGKKVDFVCLLNDAAYCRTMEINVCSKKYRGGLCPLLYVRSQVGNVQRCHSIWKKTSFAGILNFLQLQVQKDESYSSKWSRRICY